MDNIENRQDAAEGQLRCLLNTGLADLREKHCRPAEDVFLDIEQKFGFAENTPDDEDDCL